MKQTTTKRVKRNSVWGARRPRVRSSVSCPLFLLSALCVMTSAAACASDGEPVDGAQTHGIAADCSGAGVDDLDDILEEEVPPPEWMTTRWKKSRWLHPIVSSGTQWKATPSEYAADDIIAFSVPLIDGLFRHSIRITAVVGSTTLYVTSTLRSVTREGELRVLREDIEEARTKLDRVERYLQNDRARWASLLPARQMEFYQEYLTNREYAQSKVQAMSSEQYDAFMRRRNTVLRERQRQYRENMAEWQARLGQIQSTDSRPTVTHFNTIPQEVQLELVYRFASTAKMFGLQEIQIAVPGFEPASYNVQDIISAYNQANP